MEKLKKILDFLATLSPVAKWIVVISTAVAVCGVLLASCSVSTKLSGTRTLIDTTHYFIHSYSKTYDKNR